MAALSPCYIMATLQQQRIIIPGEPGPKARARVITTKTGKKTAFTPQRTKAFEKTVQTWALNQHVKRMEGPLRVVIWFWLKKARSWKVYDIDNLAKGVLDPLNKIAWDDDRQIVDLLCFKRTQIDDPMVDISISQWQETDDKKPDMPQHILGPQPIPLIRRKTGAK